MKQMLQSMENLHPPSPQHTTSSYSSPDHSSNLVEGRRTETTLETRAPDSVPPSTTATTSDLEQADFCSKRDENSLNGTNNNMSKISSFQEEPYDETMREKAAAKATNPELETILSWTPEEFAAEEKKLLRKMDLRLVPWMT